MNIFKSLNRVILISMLGITLLSGCELIAENKPTPSLTSLPLETAANDSVGLSFTPAPEPTIFTNQTRGETVARMQRRLKDLGYFNYRPTGYYLTTTVNSMQAFQQANNLGADGSAGKETLDALFTSANIMRKTTSGIPDYDPPAEAEPKSFGDTTLWESVAQLIPEGSEFSVDDLYSEHTLKLKRTGGENHLHAEPSTQEDNAQLRAMFSKVITGEKRPVLVKFEGAVIAASLYGSPHGEDTVKDNAMDGHVCIYFMGSKDDNNYHMTDVEHEANIYKAANKEQ